MPIEPTHFANVDLDLIARVDLTPLHDHIAEDVFVMNNAVHRRVHRLSIEVGNPSTIHGAFQNYGKLFDALPRRLRALWRQCHERTLDIGIHAGVEPYSRWFEISAEDIAIAARLGARIVITVYAPQRTHSSPGVYKFKPVAR